MNNLKKKDHFPMYFVFAGDELSLSYSNKDFQSNYMNEQIFNFKSYF
jgi:hypothetical protein